MSGSVIVTTTGSHKFEGDTQGLLPPPPPYTAVAVNTYPTGYSQGQGYPQPPPTQTMVHVSSITPPPDYFVFALMVTLFLCLPFGIVALVKSSEVRTKASAGDVAGAVESSAQARKWSFAGLYTGIGLYASSVLCCFLMFALALV